MVFLQNCHPVILEHVKKPVDVSSRSRRASAVLTWSFRHCPCSHVSLRRQVKDLSGYVQSEEEQLGVLLSSVSGAHEVACVSSHLVEQAKRC